MAWINEAHSEWHAVHGANNAGCPLDCMAGAEPEPGDDWVLCGACKDYHPTVADVRFCFGV